MRTSAILEAADKLQQNAVDAVTEALLLPIGVTGMLLALVENKRREMVVVDGTTWQVEMTITQCLEDAETSTATASSQQQRLGLQTRSTDSVMVNRRYKL